MIDGNTCSFGVNLHRIQKPMMAKLDAWVELWSCKFCCRCKWNNRDEFVFWHWEAPALDQALWGELCQLTLTPAPKFECKEHPF